jgi:hypothetical protein
VELGLGLGVTDWARLDGVLGGFPILAVLTAVWWLLVGSGDFYEFSKSTLYLVAFLS